MKQSFDWNVFKDQMMKKHRSNEILQLTLITLINMRAPRHRNWTPTQLKTMPSAFLNHPMLGDVQWCCKVQLDRSLWKDIVPNFFTWSMQPVWNLFHKQKRGCRFIVDPNSRQIAGKLSPIAACEITSDQAMLWKCSPLQICRLPSKRLAPQATKKGASVYHRWIK